MHYLNLWIYASGTMMRNNLFDATFVQEFAHLSAESTIWNIILVAT